MRILLCVLFTSVATIKIAAGAERMKETHISQIATGVVAVGTLVSTSCYIVNMADQKGSCLAPDNFGGLHSGLFVDLDFSHLKSWQTADVDALQSNCSTERVEPRCRATLMGRIVESSMFPALDLSLMTPIPQ